VLPKADGAAWLRGSLWHRMRRVMRRRTAAVAGATACALLAACSALPGADARPTAVVSTSAADPYGVGSVPWPQDDEAAEAWLQRMPDDVGDLRKVPADEAADGFGFVVYRSGPEQDDRSVGWFAGGGTEGLTAVLGVDEGSQPCERWESSPSLAPLAGKAGDALRTAVRALPETLPEPVPWWTCTFTHDELGEPLDEADWEWFATWASGDRTFTVSTGDEAERDALVRAAVQAAAS
jgi:hypothetical protein